MEDLVLKGYYNITGRTDITSLVVEDLVLKGYYNSVIVGSLALMVVEDLVLKGYYNLLRKTSRSSSLWKTLF